MNIIESIFSYTTWFSFFRRGKNRFIFLIETPICPPKRILFYHAFSNIAHSQFVNEVQSTERYLFVVSLNNLLWFRLLDKDGPKTLKVALKTFYGRSHLRIHYNLRMLTILTKFVICFSSCLNKAIRLRTHAVDKKWNE